MKQTVSKNNWILYLIILILVIIIVTVTSILVYKLNSQKEKKSVTFSDDNKIVEPDRNNKVILVDDKFIRYDPGLYTRPHSYPGVARHGPEFINLDL
jgi:hypothetical protein